MAGNRAEQYFAALQESCGSPDVRARAIARTHLIHCIDEFHELPTLTPDQLRMAVSLFVIHGAGYVVNGPVAAIRNVLLFGQGSGATELSLSRSVDFS
jgi:hypothetical protein